MNDIDKKILSQLQENADIPIAELSKKVTFRLLHVGLELINYIKRDI